MSRGAIITPETVTRLLQLLQEESDSDHQPVRAHLKQLEGQLDRLWEEEETLLSSGASVGTWLKSVEVGHSLPLEWVECSPTALETQCPTTASQLANLVGARWKREVSITCEDLVLLRLVETAWHIIERSIAAMGQWTADKCGDDMLDACLEHPLFTTHADWVAQVCGAISNLWTAKLATVVLSLYDFEVSLPASGAVMEETGGIRVPRDIE